MNTRIFKLISIFFSALPVITGCNENLDMPEPGNSKLVTVRLSYDFSSGTDAESVINNVTGYRFVNGSFVEAITPSRSGDANLYTFAPASFAGTLYVLCNSSLLNGLESLVPDYSSLEEFLTLEGDVEEMTGDGFLMSGKTELAESASSSIVPMTRSVARVDIESFEKGVQVQKVIIRNLADKGYAIKRDIVETSLSASESDFIKDYADSPIENKSETLLYVTEQSNNSLFVEVTVRFGGGLQLLKAKLPSVIRRNEIYTLKIHGKGAEMQLVIECEGWGTGASAESSQTLKGLVDMDNSVFSKGIRVNETRDTVFIPYYGSDFILALMSETGATVSIDGMVSGVDVNQISYNGRSSLEKIAELSIRSDLRIPGRTTERIHLDIYDNASTNLGRVVLIVEENPVKVEGLISFDDDAVCDFKEYIEGELGIISLPSGKVLGLDFDADESEWLKAAETESESDLGRGTQGTAYRILGGWKPNDPKADGRVQEGRIVISNVDGSDKEIYTVKRVNWGLPVVKIVETWWCKYNLRGNVKSFEDQITISDDPAQHNDLLSYLTSVPDDELLKLLGEQYQGGNKQGLPLRHDGNVFYHEGVVSQAQNFGLMQPTEMAPYGYRIPGYDDYLVFSKNGNFNLGGVGSRTYQNSKGQDIRITIVERNANFLGYNYGIISFYDFEIDGVHYVLNGLGHQWDTVHGNIARMNLLLATYGSGTQTWVMEGYASGVRPNENWIKYTANNATKTRLIRCIKTPVEYIYD